MEERPPAVQEEARGHCTPQAVDPLSWHCRPALRNSSPTPPHRFPSPSSRWKAANEKSSECSSWLPLRAAHAGVRAQNSTVTSLVEGARGAAGRGVGGGWPCCCTGVHSARAAPAQRAQRVERTCRACLPTPGLRRSCFGRTARRPPPWTTPAQHRQDGTAGGGGGGGGGGLEWRPGRQGRRSLQVHAAQRCCPATSCTHPLDGLAPRRRQRAQRQVVAAPRAVARHAALPVDPVCLGVVELPVGREVLQQGMQGRGALSALGLAASTGGLQRCAPRTPPPAAARTGCPSRPLESRMWAKMSAWLRAVRQSRTSSSRPWKPWPLWRRQTGGVGGWGLRRHLSGGPLCKVGAGSFGSARQPTCLCSRPGSPAPRPASGRRPAGSAPSCQWRQRPSAGHPQRSGGAGRGTSGAAVGGGGGGGVRAVAARPGPQQAGPQALCSRRVAQHALAALQPYNDDTRRVAAASTGAHQPPASRPLACV